MNRLILKDKEKFKITGGCTALVALFICEKLFVANAGDSRWVKLIVGTYDNQEKLLNIDRAAIYVDNSELISMSTDFTPLNDRQRLQHVAFQRPELLRHPKTKQKLFNR